MTGSFGARLRMQREQKGIRLDAIAQSTKIRVGLFEALEHDDASRWPSGIVRRGFIRAYANAIGLDPESTVREFIERFPDPFDERHSPVLEADYTGATPPQLRADQSGALRLTLAEERHGPVLETKYTSATPLQSQADESGALRLTLADEPLLSTNSFADPRRSWRMRASAAVHDLAIVIAIGAVVFAAAGLSWMAFTVATICYYFGSALVGNSPGARLVAHGGRKRAPQQRVAPTPLPSGATTDDEILRRFSTHEYISSPDIILSSSVGKIRRS